MTSPERPPRSPEIACNHLETEHPERMRTQPRTQDALATPRDRSRAPRLRLGTPRHHLGTVPHSLGRPGPPSRDAHGTISGRPRHHLGFSGRLRTPSWDTVLPSGGAEAPSWDATTRSRDGTPPSREVRDTILGRPRHHLGTVCHYLETPVHTILARSVVVSSSRGAAAPSRNTTPPSRDGMAPSRERPDASQDAAQRLSRRPPPKREKPSRDEIWSLGTSISRDGCETISGGTLPRALSR